MEYILYPCSEVFYKKMLKKIKVVAKQTKMKIVSIDIEIKMEASAGHPAIYNSIIKLKHLPEKKQYGFNL